MSLQFVLTARFKFLKSLDEGFSREEALEFVNLRSRDNARTPFPWTGERYGGFSDARPWIGMTEEWPRRNAEAQEGDPESVLNFYRKAIRFRREGAFSDCLVDGTLVPLASSEDVIAYLRTHTGRNLYCWFNLGPNEASETLPEDGLQPVWFTDEQPAIEGGALQLRPWQTVLMAQGPALG